MTPPNLNKVSKTDFQETIPDARLPFWMKISQEQLDLEILTSEYRKDLKKSKLKLSVFLEVMVPLDA